MQSQKEKNRWCTWANLWFASILCLGVGPSISWWCLGLLGLWASQVSWASMSFQDTWASWASSMLKAFLKAFNIEEAQEAHVSWKDKEAQETWEAQRPKRPKRPRHHQLMEGRTLYLYNRRFTMTIFMKYIKNNCNVCMKIGNENVVCVLFEFIHLNLVSSWTKKCLGFILWRLLNEYIDPHFEGDQQCTLILQKAR